MPTETIVGIDLGTTNSAIGIVEGGLPRLIHIDGAPTMPSCVGLAESGEMLVGQPALNQLAALPGQTVVSVKRLMGSGKAVQLGDKEFTPEEISAFILKRLKAEAEQDLGHAVEKAVVTVPAFFDENQRRATQHAAELAGLEAVRILNEPTAAALAYNLRSQGSQTVLVYDLGGGTFDVSLVSCEEGMVEVRASHGDTHLGGDDLDDALAGLLAGEWPHKPPLDRDAIQVSRRLKVAAEAAKRHLSDHPFADVQEDFLQDGHHLQSELSRDAFEELAGPLLAKTWDSLHAALQDGGKTSRDIDKILLVGGSTRIPLVQRMIEEKTGHCPSREVNPDLVVAMGAAIQGAILAGEDVGSILVDIATHTYSTQVLDQYHENLLCAPVIPRGTPLPVSRSEAFYTVYPGQEEVSVKVYQGESNYPEENMELGDFMVEGLAGMDDQNTVLCQFSLDLDGLLEVTATEKATGLAKGIKIDTRSANASYDLEAARQRMAEISPEEGDVGEEGGGTRPSTSGGDNPGLARAKDLRKRAGKLLESGLDPEDEADLNRLLEESREAVKAGDYAKLSECSDLVEDIVFYLED